MRRKRISFGHVSINLGLVSRILLLLVARQFVAVAVVVASLWCTTAMPLLLVLSPLPTAVMAHPGAVANGRATCGTEYSTAATAYVIPDMTEAWYIRRVATCASPVFWTAFDVTEVRQPLYIAVMSPEIARFQDELQFHMLLYGPGVNTSLPGLSAVPTNFPDTVQVETNLGGVAYATSPSNFSSCAFVDTNPVMRYFSDVIAGRCMEEFTISDPQFEDALQRNTTTYNWWLYSYNHVAADLTGRFYLQTWLTRRNSTNVTVTGKYEITLGPWTWRGYASQATLDLAQEQGTTCACAVNALDFKEQYIERLGGLDTDFYDAHLPLATCQEDDSNNTPTSPCVTISPKPYLSAGSAVEWSAVYTLTTGRTYAWTFRSYYLTLRGGWQYPDPGMWVYLTTTTSNNTTDNTDVLAINEALTNAALDEARVPVDTDIVAEGEAIALNRPQWIAFTDPQTEVSTTVFIQSPSSSSANPQVAVFTQHVPSEFMAHFLVDTTTGEYVFPSASTLYVDDGTTTTATPNATTPTTAPTGMASSSPSNIGWASVVVSAIAVFTLLSCHYL